MKVTKHTKTRYCQIRTAVAKKNAEASALHFKKMHYDTGLTSDPWFRHIRKGALVMVSGPSGTWKLGMTFRMIAGACASEPLDNEMVLNFSETEIGDLSHKGHTVWVSNGKLIPSLDSVATGIEDIVKLNGPHLPRVRFVVLDDLWAYFTPKDPDQRHMEFGLESNKVVEQLRVLCMKYGITIFMSNHTKNEAVQPELPRYRVLTMQADEVYLNHYVKGQFVTSLKHKFRTMPASKRGSRQTFDMKHIEKFASRNFLSKIDYLERMLTNLVKKDNNELNQLRARQQALVKACRFWQANTFDERIDEHVHRILEHKFVYGVKYVNLVKKLYPDMAAFVSVYESQNDEPVGYFG